MKFKGRLFLMLAVSLLLTACVDDIPEIDTTGPQDSIDSEPVSDTTPEPSVSATSAPIATPEPSVTEQPLVTPTPLSTQIPAVAPTATPKPTSTPQPPLFNQPFARVDWDLSASSNTAELLLAIDGDVDTRWTTRVKQSPDQWLQIDMGSVQIFNRIILDSEGSPNDAPLSYELYLSQDGENWGAAVTAGNDHSAVTVIDFNESEARFLKLVQLGTSNQYWWSIHEINVMLSDGSEPTSNPTSTPTAMPTSTPTQDPTPTASPVPTMIPSPEPTPSVAEGDAVEGLLLYESTQFQCVLCHGIDGNSATYPIDATSDFYQHKSASGVDYSLADYVQNFMPPAGGCDAQCALDIAAYIRSWNDPMPEATATPQVQPSAQPTSTPTVVDCSDMPALMQQADLNCTASSCHDSSPSQAAKISLVGSVDELAVRFANTSSVNSNCGGEKIIDVAEPSNSLLLKIIDPDSGDQCTSKMAPGTSGIAPEYMQCFSQWVDDIIAHADVNEDPQEAFVAADAYSALNKSKMVASGRAVTDAELAAVTRTDNSLDRDALKIQIDRWMASDEFTVKFKNFLQLSLQQKNMNTDTVYRNQFDVLASYRKPMAGRILENFEESFVRTAYSYFENGTDFRNVATTRTWKVTTAMLLALSYADYEARLPFWIRGTDEKNPLYSFAYLCGDVDTDQDCEGIDDYSDWRDVTLTQGSAPANFEFSQAMADNLRAIGDGDSYAFYAPRVGYFTTPVFLQSWQSNVGNQFRMTINQTLIVGLGKTFEAGDSTPEGNQDALDRDHAGEDQPECYACHRLMDPMRAVFQNSYHVSRSRALATPGNVTAAFAFQGMEADIASLDDLGAAIAQHPDFAKAWVGKLCNWATSQVCDTSGEEFTRLVDVFVNNGYQMKPLVKEMFASPLVTAASYVDDFEVAQPFVSISRKNHFCDTVEHRINQMREDRGLEPSPKADICARGGSSAYVGVLPEDQFARGKLHFVQSVVYDPFLVKAYEKVCASASTDAVRHGAGNDGTNYNYLFDANDVPQAVEDMTVYLMGFPKSHENYQQVNDALQKIYDIYKNPTVCEDSGGDIIADNVDGVSCGFGYSTANSLREVWKFACSSPALTGLGL